MEPVSGVENMPSVDHDPASRDRLTARWVELTIRLGVPSLLLYLSFTLVRPFITVRDLERCADGRALFGVRLDGWPASTSAQ